MNKLRSLILALLAMATCSGGFPVADYHAVDNNGDPCNGCLLYTYIVGTTTDKATYSDDALSSANANPIVADSAGRFGRIYLLEDECYKFVLKDSTAATTYYTIDDVCGDQLTNASFETRFDELMGKANDCAGDGSTDDATCLQTALTACQSSNGIVDLLGKTYRVDSAISMNSSCTIQNGTLDLSQATAGQLQIEGSGLTGGAVTTGNTSIGDISFTSGTVTGLTRGDLLFLHATGSTWATSGDAGEIQTVESASGTTITLNSPMYAAYLTADTAQWQKVGTIDDVSVRNINIITDSAVTTNPISIKYGRRILLSGVTVSRTTTPIAVIMSDGVTIQDSTILTTSAATALEVGDVSRDLEIYNVRVEADASGTSALVVGGTSTHQGQTRFVNVENCWFSVEDGTTQAVSFSAHTHYVEFIGNTVLGILSTSSAGSGVLYSGADGIIDRNFIRGAFGDNGITISPSVDMTTIKSIIVSNNEVSGSGFTSNQDYGISAVIGANVTIEALEIRANDIDMDFDADTEGISVVQTNSTSTIQTLHILDNAVTIGTTGNEAIHVQTTDNGITSASIGFNDLLVGDVVLTDVDNLEVFENHMVSGLVLIDGDSATMGAVSFQGNQILAGTGLEINASNAAGLTNISIEGNQIDGSDPINIDGYATGTLITGNILDDSGASGNVIDIAGAVSGGVTDLIVASNIIYDGAYGISLSNTDGTRTAGANIFKNQATGDTTGDAFDAEVFTSPIAAPNLTTVEKVLSNSDLLNLAATPITLVANVAGQIHVPTEIVCQHNYGGTNAWIAGAGDDFDVRWVDGSGVVLLSELETDAWIEDTADSYAVAQAVDLTGANAVTTAQGVNVPIVISNNGSEITGNAGADNTMTCWLTYRTHIVD